MSRQPLHHRSIPRLVVCAVIGLAAGWTVCAGASALWTWLVVRRMDGDQTREHASAEDSGRAAADVIWTTAILASLGGVGLLLAAGSDQDSASYLHAGLGVLTVVSSWFLIHIVYMLRYAREYWGFGAEQAIKFPGDDTPDYRDFAYLSFCLGMTYQVSDNDIRRREVRRTVLQHTLLSYLLGAVVVACTVNLVVQIGSGQ